MPNIHFFFVFLPVLAIVCFFPPIFLVFEIDAMLPNELLLPSLFIDHELLNDDSTYM